MGSKKKKKSNSRGGKISEKGRKNPKKLDRKKLKEKVRRRTARKAKEWGACPGGG